MNIFNKSNRGFRCDGILVKPGNNEVPEPVGEKLLRLYPIEIIPFAASGEGAMKKVHSLEDEIKDLKEEIRVLTNDRDALKAQVEKLSPPAPKDEDAKEKDEDELKDPKKKAKK